MTRNDGEHDPARAPARRIPAAFHRLRTLGILNAAAVGLAMASIVASFFSGRVPIAWGGGFDPRETIGVGVATALAGALWVWVMRSPKAAGWRGWLASVPLTMLCAALASGLADVLGASEPLTAGGLLKDALLAASIYAVVWLPVLLLMLLFFGVSIAAARRLAARGLAGEEQGERIVGVTCAVWGLLAFVLLIPAYEESSFDRMRTIGWFLRTACAVSGALAGGAAASLALARERRRRSFVAGVETGEISGWRVDLAGEGKVLVRLPREGDYRASDPDEKVFELDASGAAISRVLEAGPAAPPNEAMQPTRAQPRSARQRARG